ncbi:MAG TPA: LD-carboxypeptidase [Vicinamibacterales bacterium]|nr:LD-carboxypeptidase [Vicinamibacterales bacterium]
MKHPERSRGVKRLRRLQSGDRIALVAPASSFPHEEVTAGVAELRRLGFEPVYDDTIFDKERFVAGSVETRVRAIVKAWEDPSIAALIAMRGGYGSAQLLPFLDPAILVAGRKALIGYSDITSLLDLYLRCGLTAIHGPMVDRRLSRGVAAYDEDSFRRVLMHAEPAGDLSPAQLEVLHPGSARGVLVGGTLTQLMASMGTPWAFAPPPGSVLFLEDIGERPYRIHRLLTQAAQAGVFEHARAIVFGEFPGCDEPGGDPAIKDVLRDFTADFHGPVLFNFPSGHTTGATWTLPLGVEAEVISGPSPSLSILDAAVD